MSDDEPNISVQHPFHPTDPPHGLRNFDLGAISKDQQRELNGLKTKRRIENEIYLKAHPEIRGLICILFRHVTSKQSEGDIHEIVGEFFNRPRHELITDLLDYFGEINCSDPVVYKLRKEAESAAIRHRDSSSVFESSTTDVSSLLCSSEYSM